MKNNNAAFRMSRFISIPLFASLFIGLFAGAASAANESGVFVSLNRSELISTSTDMGQVIIANPDVADIVSHSLRKFSIVGKRVGRTNVRVFDKQSNVIRSFDVQVGYDLPAIRRALWQFLRNERIGVEMVNTNIALTGEVSNAAIAEQALRIVEEFIYPSSERKDDSKRKQEANFSVLNLMKVVSGQQVMLRVRVGEMRRSAIKNLGTSLIVRKFGGSSFNGGGTGGGTRSFNSETATGAGEFEYTSSTDAFASIFSTYAGSNFDIGAMIEALETNGLFRSLAEPNLIAMSGEEAEFLAGGEFPVPVAQSSSSGSVSNTVQFKPYGVAVKFIPFVLNENRIRVTVQPEVSEIDRSEGTSANGLTIPAVTTRRAKTTVELAPGESFMIAGLLSDRSNTGVDQIPGVGEIPILSALFRSTAYQRSETELVIAVTPYLVDPLKSSDVRLPSEDFRPASMMERMFYGAMGSLSGGADRISQTPSLEGPIGFMVD